MDFLIAHPGAAIACAGILGLIVGSFLNVVILRLPERLMHAWRVQSREMLELDAVAEATNNLPHIPGGKKLIYTHVDLPLTPIADFEKLGETNELFRELALICNRNKGLWSVEAETFLLNYYHKL